MGGGIILATTYYYRTWTKFFGPRSIVIYIIRAVETPKTAEQLIIETYAKILLDQNKSLLLTLISKNTIMVPKSPLENIINQSTIK